MEALGFSHAALTVTHWDKSKPFWEALLSYLGAAKVIDVVNNSTKSDVTILIENGKIQALGKSSATHRAQVCSPPPEGREQAPALPLNMPASSPPAATLLW